MTDPREAIVAAIKHFTEDPDRCDMQDREAEVADEVLRRLAEVEFASAEAEMNDPDAWGDAVEGPPKLVIEIAQMERLADELYARARRMRELGRYLAASGVEAAAFSLVCEANSHSDQMRAGEGR